MAKSNFKDWPGMSKALNPAVGELNKSAPGAMKAFHELGASALAAGALARSARLVAGRMFECPLRALAGEGCGTRRGLLLHHALALELERHGALPGHIGGLHVGLALALEGLLIRDGQRSR